MGHSKFFFAFCSSYYLDARIFLLKVATSYGRLGCKSDAAFLKISKWGLLNGGFGDLLHLQFIQAFEPVYKQQQYFGPFVICDLLYYNNSIPSCFIIIKCLCIVPSSVPLRHLFIIPSGRFGHVIFGILYSKYLVDFRNRWAQGCDTGLIIAST